MSSGQDAKRFCFLTVRFCLNIYQINAKCINIFCYKMRRYVPYQRILHQFFGAKCVDIAKAFCYRKNQNVTIVTLVQNALYQRLLTAKLISAFCFQYIDSTIPLLSKSEISSLRSSSVALQPGLCRTWSETRMLVFL